MYEPITIAEALSYIDKKVTREGAERVLNCSSDDLNDVSQSSVIKNMTLYNKVNVLYFLLREG